MAVKHAKYDFGRIDGTSLTGSYQSVVALEDDAIMVIIFNNCDYAVDISLDGGTTKHFESCADNVVLDLWTNKVLIAAPDIQVKHSGTVPTEGSVRVTTIRI